MNGAHDLGGMHGFGAVQAEAGEPVFHAGWERRAFAVTLACGALGEWNLDMSRFARERMPPAEYLATSYYEHWLYGLQVLLAERGLVDEAEIRARMDLLARGETPPPAPPAARRAVAPDAAAEGLRRGASARQPDSGPARFTAGDVVRVRNAHPAGHTRAPRYVRGRRGVVHLLHGTFIFPDSHARDGQRCPQHCYAVRFTARELWGPQGGQHEQVLVDLWDDYLEPA